MKTKEAVFWIVSDFRLMIAILSIMIILNNPAFVSGFLRLFTESNILFVSEISQRYKILIPPQHEILEGPSVLLNLLNENFSLDLL